MIRLLLLSVLLFMENIAYEGNFNYTITQDEVTLSAHIMSAQESSDTFLHNMHAYQICPLQLVITNNSSKILMISGNSIDELALVPPNTITSGIIYKNQTAAILTAYACALTSWIAFFAGFSAVQESLPLFVVASKHLTSTIALLTFFYQAHRFSIKNSTQYALTHKSIMHYGLSNSNMIIHPNSTATFVMFLNNKSYTQPPSSLDTFYYLFSLKLYNLYDSTDIMSIPIEVPKVQSIPSALSL